MVDTPEPEWTLSLRIPAWAGGATIAGEPDPAPGTYARIRRAWRPGDVVELTLPMAVRFVRADPRVDR